MKKKIASLLAVATMLAAVPAFAATPDVMAGQPGQNVSSTFRHCRPPLRPCGR